MSFYFLFQKPYATNPVKMADDASNQTDVSVPMGINDHSVQTGRYFMILQFCHL